MAVPNERQSTERVLGDSRYHRASLKADPAAAHLAARVEEGEEKLRDRARATEEAEDARVEALAVLGRDDFELDTRCRLVELEVLGGTAKNRASVEYRACFPRGLSDLLAERGAEQARSVEALVAQLRARLPEIAERHGESLLALGKRAAESEAAYLAAEKAHANAFQEERLARVELIRQLQKNEGALRELYPGENARVRSYFRAKKRRVEVEDVEGVG